MEVQRFTERLALPCVVRPMLYLWVYRMQNGPWNGGNWRQIATTTLRQRKQNPHDIEVKSIVKGCSTPSPQLLAVTDAKSLYDTVNKESYSHTER
eukprot:5461122-Amphidinium_carterae.1